MTYSGRMAPLVELQLVDDAGTEIPWGTGESGRLLIRGPWITGSYYKNPAATAATQQTAGSTPVTWRRSMPPAP